MKTATPIDLAGILELPAAIKGIVWDMDGVLVDTLGADFRLCVAAADRVLGRSDWLKPETAARHFALDPPAFWRELLRDAPIPASKEKFAELVAVYDRLRAETQFPLLPGIAEILADCDAKAIRCAVASSNPATVVEDILERTGISARFAAVSALGANGVRPKPAPDLYFRAVDALQLPSTACAFVEDSITGLTAGRAAHFGYAIAVATGPASFATLTASGLADVVYARFEPRRCTLIDGRPMQKNLRTPNDFASHMAEHIAWRLGVGIDLAWPTDDWRGLGRYLGGNVAALRFRKEAAAALGMIDDGASEVLIAFDEPAGLDFAVHPSLSRERIERMRVEQIGAGSDLVDMLDGFAHGVGARITARMCTFEDPHHSWEGLYRAVGICLARLRA